MPVPKRRKSSSRSRMHKAHNALDRPSWVTCPQCQSPMRLHRACMSCGYYLRKSVLEIKS